MKSLFCPRDTSLLGGGIYVTALFMIDILNHVSNEEPNTKNLRDNVVGAHYIPNHST
jgi:hypothetical protein